MARAQPGSELSFASWSGGMAHWRRNAAASHPPRVDAMVVAARALGSAEDEGRSSSFNGYSRKRAGRGAADDMKTMAT